MVLWFHDSEIEIGLMQANHKNKLNIFVKFLLPLLCKALNGKTTCKILESQNVATIYFAWIKINNSKEKIAMTKFKRTNSNDAETILFK